MNDLLNFICIFSLMTIAMCLMGITFILEEIKNKLK